MSYTTLEVYNIVHVYYLGLLLGPCLEAKKGSYESTTVSQSVLGKSLSQVIYENALNQLDWKFFQVFMEVTVWSCNFHWVYLVKHALSALKKKIGNTDFEERFVPSMWFCGFKFENLQKSHDCKKSNSWLVI